MPSAVVSLEHLWASLIDFRSHLDRGQGEFENKLSQKKHYINYSGIIVKLYDVPAKLVR